MSRPERFEVMGKKYMVCKLNISFYGLKQTYSQWFLKFHQVVSAFGFKESAVD